MKKNFKKTLSLVLAVLMVITAIPFSGMATSEECEHNYDYTSSPIAGKHYKTCLLCYDNSLVDCSTEEEICEQQRVCKDCGASYGDIVAHKYIEEVAEADYIKTAGNCKTETVYYKSCKCGALPVNLDTAATFTRLDENAHVWGEGVSNNDATCTQDGTMSATCTICQTTSETAVDEGSMLPHTFTKKIKDADHLVREATCAQTAIYWYACEVCNLNAKDSEGAEDNEGLVYEDEKLEHIFAIPEEPTPEEIKTPATCTSRTICYKVCVDCGALAKGENEETYEFGDVIPHTYAEVVDVNNESAHLLVPATCSQGAIYSMSCSVCGYDAISKEESMRPDAEIYIKGESTLEEGETYNAFRVNNPRMHSQTKITKEAKEPTCTADGWTEEVSCAFDDCLGADGKNTVLQPSEKKAALGHDYSKTLDKEYIAPTCKQYGQYGQVKCVREGCGKTFYINEKNEMMTIDNVASFVFALEPLGHEDKDGDMVCDRESCGGLLEPEDLCDCICHSSGFLYFIAALLKFLWRVTGSRPYCECGIAHYSVAD